MAPRPVKIGHIASALALTAAAYLPGTMLRAEPPAHDYPTSARVEYVQECMSRNGGSLATLYQCSCVIDHMAAQLSFDDFVEAATFARNSSLGGEGGAIFRDPQRAREQARLFRTLESKAYRACGLKADTTPKR